MSELTVHYTDYSTIISPYQPAPLEKAFELLGAIEKLVSDSSSLSRHLAEIQRILSNDAAIPSFKYSRDHAQLHDSVSSLAIAASTHRELKEILTCFLDTLQNFIMHYPDGEQVVNLDFSYERHLIESLKTPEIEIEALDLSLPFSEEDKDAIWLIQNESFGTYELPPRTDFENWIKKESHTLLVTRNKITHSIVGILLFETNKDSLDLYILARNASIAKCGIGTQLMNYFITHYLPEGLPISLSVRESHHHAQNFYRKFGFEETGQSSLPRQACPMERDLKMTRKPL